MNTTTPTAAEFAALVANYEDLARAHGDMPDCGPNHDPVAEGRAKERADRAYDALINARPTEPAALAAQLRWLIGEMLAPDEAPDSDFRILDHVAGQLEAMS